jgi:phasin family protein
MTSTTENYATAHKSAVESTLAVSQTLFDSSERLAALNLNTSRALLIESTTKFKELLDAKCPEEFFGLQSVMAQPILEKTLGYYRNYHDIAAQCMEDAVKPFEAQFATISKLFATELGRVAKSVPGDSNVALEVVRNGLTAAQATAGQFNKATGQIVEIAEANVAAAGEATVKALNDNAGSSKRNKSA